MLLTIRGTYALIIGEDCDGIFLAFPEFVIQAFSFVFALLILIRDGLDSSSLVTAL